MGDIPSYSDLYMDSNIQRRLERDRRRRTYTTTAFTSPVLSGFTRSCLGPLARAFGGLLTSVSMTSSCCCCCGWCSSAAVSIQQSLRSATYRSSCPVHMQEGGLSVVSLKTTIPPSCPAAMAPEVGCAANTQKRSMSRLNVWRQVRRDTSHTLMVLSSESEISKSRCGWKTKQDTLLLCPRSVSTSQAFTELYLKMHPRAQTGQYSPPNARPLG